MILRSLCPGNYAFLQHLEVMQDLSINSNALDDTRIPDPLYDLEYISKLKDFVSSIAEVPRTGVQMRGPQSLFATWRAFKIVVLFGGTLSGGVCIIMRTQTGTII